MTIPSMNLTCWCSCFKIIYRTCFFFFLNFTFLLLASTWNTVLRITVFVFCFWSKLKHYRNNRLFYIYVTIYINNRDYYLKIYITTENECPFSNFIVCWWVGAQWVFFRNLSQNAYFYLRLSTFSGNAKSTYEQGEVLFPYHV